MKSYRNSAGFTPVLLLIYGTAIILAGFAGILGYKEFRLQNTNKVIATPPPLALPTDTTSQIAYTSADPDPVIDCSINPLCGGGSKRLKTTECKNMVCCTFDKKCGGPQFVTNYECKTLYSCYLSNGTCKLLASKSACDNYSAGQDSDPVMDCNSKTGMLKVKRSICLSYTDCPNGNGGYVFESQDACKQRWAQIGNQITNNTQNFINNLNLNSTAAYQQILQNYQQATNNILNNSNSALDLPKTTTPYTINFNGFIRTINPTAGHCIMDLTTGEQVCPPSAVPSTFQNHCIIDLTTGVQSCS